MKLYRISYEISCGDPSIGLDHVQAHNEAEAIRVWQAEYGEDTPYRIAESCADGTDDAKILPGLSFIFQVEYEPWEPGSGNA